MNLIRLNWKPEGYKPDGYDWHNFVLNDSTRSLRHDLYHHQKYESGTEEEEFRALGARYYFDDCVGLIIDNIENLYFKSLKKNASKFVPSMLPFEKNIFVSIAVNLGVDNPYYYANVLTKGFNYASKYSKDAYDKFLGTNLEYEHYCKKDLVIDLDLGVIHESRNIK